MCCSLAHVMLVAFLANLTPRPSRIIIMQVEDFGCWLKPLFATATTYHLVFGGKLNSKFWHAE